MGAAVMRSATLGAARSVVRSCPWLVLVLFVRLATAPSRCGVGAGVGAMVRRGNCTEDWGCRLAWNRPQEGVEEGHVGVGPFEGFDCSAVL